MSLKTFVHNNMLMLEVTPSPLLLRSKMITSVVEGGRKLAVDLNTGVLFIVGRESAIPGLHFYLNNQANFSSPIVNLPDNVDDAVHELQRLNRSNDSLKGFMVFSNAAVKPCVFTENIKFENFIAGVVAHYSRARANFQKV